MGSAASSLKAAAASASVPRQVQGVWIKGVQTGSGVLMSVIHVRMTCHLMLVFVELFTMA